LFEPISVECYVNTRAQGHSAAEVGGDTFIELLLEGPWQNEPSPQLDRMLGERP